MGRLDAYSDNSPRGSRTTCECGKPKLLRRVHGCEDCRFQDGERLAHTRVIELLRLTDGMTQAELERAAGYPRGGLNTTLSTLRNAGRLERVEGETDPVEYSGRSRYGGRQYMTTSSKCWVYFLSTKRRSA